MSIATYVFIDLETTGIPSQELNKTRITEISMVAVKSEHVMDTRAGAAPRVQNKITLCLNPKRMVQPGCTETTGLCNDLLEHETAFNHNVFTILDTFLKVLTKPVCLIAHNGFSFDFPILKRHLEDLNVSFDEELLCADSYYAFYDILEAKEQEVIKNQTQEPEETDKTVEMPPTAETTIKMETPNTPERSNEDEPDFTRMQKNNETTPKQQIIRNSIPLKVGKVRKRFPWSEGAKPKNSYRLMNIYERLLNRPALNAHRAEVDCIMMMESAVAISKQFVVWVAKHHKCFSEVKAMTLGVRIGDY